MKKIYGIGAVMIPMSIVARESSGDMYTAIPPTGWHVFFAFFLLFCFVVAVGSFLYKTLR